MSKLVLNITHSDRWHAVRGPSSGVADTVVFHNGAGSPCLVWFEENTFGIKGIVLDSQSTFPLQRKGNVTTACHVGSWAAAGKGLAMGIGGMTMQSANIDTVTIPDL